MGYETHSIEVKSFASPEGSVNLNDNVSEKRAASTLRFLKRMLRKAKLNGVDNEELYTEISEGEDWEGFNKLMRSSDIKDRRRITKIVNSVEDLEKENKQLEIWLKFMTLLKKMYYHN